MANRIDFETLNKTVLTLLGNSESLAISWWNSANSAFGCKTPFEMYKQDPEKVKDYLLDYLQK